MLGVLRWSGSVLLGIVLYRPEWYVARNGTSPGLVHRPEGCCIAQKKAEGEGEMVLKVGGGGDGFDSAWKWLGDRSGLAWK